MTSSVSLQAMVPTNSGDGIASTPETEDEIFFNSIFEVIRAYKYPTLSCMKRHESINKSLMILGCKSIKKVLSILLLLYIYDHSKKGVRLVKVVS